METSDMHQDTDVVADNNQPLVGQISEMQCMVLELKKGFTAATDALSQIQHEDVRLQRQLEDNKRLLEDKLSGVVEMVLSIKTELDHCLGQFHLTMEDNRTLQARVHDLQDERNALLERLKKCGGSNCDRDQLTSVSHSPLQRTAECPTLHQQKSKESVSTKSSENDLHADHDSGVQMCNHGDGSSCSDSASLHKIQSCMSVLKDHTAADVNIDEIDDDDDDDRQSVVSLSVVANKSLDMSRSLEEKCLRMAEFSSSEDEEVEQMTSTGGADGALNRLKKTPKKLKHLSVLEQTSSYHASTNSPRRTAQHDYNVKEALRSRIAREILETERKYCSSLWILVDHFAGAVQQSGIVSQKEVETMFPTCLRTLYQHHTEFLHKLEYRLINWKWQCILGDIFAMFTECVDFNLLLQYKIYVNEFSDALRLLRRTSRRFTAFRKLIRNLESHPICENLDVSAYLLTPIQRMPRYILLLKQLLRYTESDHPDHYNIEACLNRLGQFLSELNESIEHSIQMVSTGESPKTRGGRFNLSSFSFRSSGSSGCERGTHFPFSRGSFRMKFGNDTRPIMKRCDFLNPRRLASLPDKPTGPMRAMPLSSTSTPAAAQPTSRGLQREQTFHGFDHPDGRNTTRQPRPSSCSLDTTIVSGVLASYIPQDRREMIPGSSFLMEESFNAGSKPVGCLEVSQMDSLRKSDGVEYDGMADSSHGGHVRRRSSKRMRNFGVFGESELVTQEMLTGSTPHDDTASSYIDRSSGVPETYYSGSLKTEHIPTTDQLNKDNIDRLTVKSVPPDTSNMSSPCIVLDVSSLDHDDDRHHLPSKTFKESSTNTEHRSPEQLSTTMISQSSSKKVKDDHSSSMCELRSGLKKRLSFKESIKNIFTRKRGSRVFEGSSILNVSDYRFPSVMAPDQSLNVSATDYWNGYASTGPSFSRFQTPTRHSSTSVQIDYSTNNPCSAV